MIRRRFFQSILGLLGLGAAPHNAEPIVLRRDLRLCLTDEQMADSDAATEFINKLNPWSLEGKFLA